MNNNELPPKIESKESYLEMFLEKLNYKRFECIDDLPPNLLLPGDKDYHKYKCRTNWWHKTMEDMDFLLYRIPDISDETKNLIAEFKTYIKNIDYTKFRVKEEIDTANKFLDKLIDLLNIEKSK